MARQALNPWADGGSGLPEDTLLRLLLFAASSTAAQHGRDTSTRYAVTHGEPVPLDPRTRLRELGSVCRLWLSALSRGDDVWHRCAVDLYFAPPELPPALWRGALGFSVGQGVLYRRSQRGTVTAVEMHGAEEPSYMVRMADGSERDTVGTLLWPIAPWRRLCLALMAARYGDAALLPAEGSDHQPHALHFGARCMRQLTTNWFFLPHSLATPVHARAPLQARWCSLRSCITTGATRPRSWRAGRPRWRRSCRRCMLRC
jgi:hypothetical protein